MYTDLLLKSVAAVAAAMALACSCEGAGDEVPEQEPQDMERPVDLVTGVYTAYPSGMNACVDSYLSISFGSEPELGTQGRILILDGDGRTVDGIDMADVASGKPLMTGSSIFNTAMDAIGSSASGYYRIVYYNPVTVSGNTVTIRPHSGKLDYGGKYSVVIEEGAVVADGFGGIRAGEWDFTVMPQPEKDGEVTVGSRDCDFMTVQGAVNFANSCGQSRDMTISVTPGVYEEQLYIRNKDNLTIRGESPEGTIIRFDNCNDYVDGVGSGVQSVPGYGEPVGRTGGRSVVLVENCDMLRLEGLTLENTHGDGSQAETIYFNCENGRLVAVDCIFTSEQDTIELKGKSVFDGCTVTGDVDFIWGYPEAALFSDCEIRSCASGRGYIVQARCGSGDLGFVFLDCRLTAESGVADGSVYLARSGGNASEYDNVTYADCRMGGHIADEGWYPSPAPTPSAATDGNGWKEYGSRNISGVIMDVSSRYHGSRQLSLEEYGQLQEKLESEFSFYRF